MVFGSLKLLSRNNFFQDLFIVIRTAPVTNEVVVYLVLN